MIHKFINFSGKRQGRVFVTSDKKIKKLFNLY